MKSITVNTAPPYRVLAGNGLLAGCGRAMSEVHGPCRVMLVTDSNVAPLYADTAVRSLRNAGFSPETFVFPAGEGSKNLTVWGQLLSCLAVSGFTRGDMVAALGGGVTGDLAGFAAAAYLRGIPVVQFPTTLLAAVDASAGGKTAVDLPEGKNLAGAFWQPSLVLCDTDCFSTLPRSEILSGLAECVKHALIADPSMLDAMLAPGFVPDAGFVLRNVGIKVSFVVGDERDRGRRQCLNFGHTFGHAVEAESGYSLSHGSCVALGMLAAVRWAFRTGRGTFPPGRFEALLDRLGLPVRCPFGAEAVARQMFSDKKRFGDTVNLVVVPEPGRADTVPVPVNTLYELAEAGTEEPTWS